MPVSHQIKSLGIPLESQNINQGDPQGIHRGFVLVYTIITDPILLFKYTVDLLTLSLPVKGGIPRSLLSPSCFNAPRRQEATFPTKPQEELRIVIYQRRRLYFVNSTDAPSNCMGKTRRESEGDINQTTPINPRRGIEENKRTAIVDTVGSKIVGGMLNSYLKHT